jgi:hypothetical protein
MTDEPSQKQLLNNITYVSNETTQRAIDQFSQQASNRPTSNRRGRSAPGDFTNKVTDIQVPPLVWKYALQKVGRHGVNRLEVGVDEDGVPYVIIHNHPIR